MQSVKNDKCKGKYTDGNNCLMKMKIPENKEEEKKSGDYDEGEMLY